MTSKHPPTLEQAAIIDAARRPTSMMIKAFAGSGKTSTLEMAAPQVQSTALALAFNKKIATELQTRLPSNFLIKTLNGLGHSAWQRKREAQGLAGRLQLDERKTGKIVSQVIKDSKIQLSQDDWSTIRTLVSKAQLRGIVPDDAGAEPLAPDTPEEWRDLCQENGVLDDDQVNMLGDLAREALIADIKMARDGVVSFDDQVYLSACLGGLFTRFPRVMLDEAQDVNRLNHKMVQKSLREDGHLMVVGDSRQSIYAFRGADTRSMEKLRAMRDSEAWIDLPLSMTFRCPKVVVARQQKHAPGFTAHDSCKDGRITSLQEPEALREDEVWSGWRYEDLTKARAPGSIAVLCRNNGPLLGMAFKLLRSNIGCHILGRDIGKSLIALTRKIAASDDVTSDAFVEKLEEWTTSEASKLKVEGKEHLIEGILDRSEALRCSLAGSLAKTAGELRRALELLFSRDAGVITLSTIHRAKGLEWDSVVHLDPWRLPSKWAKRAAQAGDHAALEQEWNLLYVAETRTKHTLIHANLEDFTI